MSWPEAFFGVVAVLGGVAYFGFLTGAIKINIGRREDDE